MSSGGREASASSRVDLNSSGCLGSNLWWSQQWGHASTLANDQAEPKCGVALVAACEAVQVVFRGNVFYLYRYLSFLIRET